MSDQGTIWGKSASRFRGRLQGFSPQEREESENLLLKLSPADNAETKLKPTLELKEKWWSPEFAQVVAINETLLHPAFTANPVQWWRDYGYKMPSLQVSWSLLPRLTTSCIIAIEII